MLKDSRQSLFSEAAILEQFLNPRLPSLGSDSRLSLQNVCIQLYDPCGLDEGLPKPSLNNRSTAITLSNKSFNECPRQESSSLKRNHSYYLQDKLNHSILELSRFRSRKKLRPIRSKILKSPYAAGISHKVLERYCRSAEASRFQKCRRPLSRRRIRPLSLPRPRATAH